MSQRRSKTTQPQEVLQGLFTILAVMLLLKVIDSLFGGKLSYWLGLHPRHLDGLIGIVCAPWLHGDWNHLFSNLPALLVLSALLMLQSFSGYIRGSIFIILFSGLLVWCLGRNSIHIGASGWVLGLWAWLLGRAIFQRRLMDIGIAALVIFFYGGMVWGLLPKQGVSVESHLAGAFAGGLLAFYQRKR